MSVHISIHMSIHVLVHMLVTCVYIYASIFMSIPVPIQVRLIEICQICFVIYDIAKPPAAPVYCMYPTCIWHACCMYVACMLHACCMHAECMLHVYCMHAECMFHVCCILHVYLPVYPFPSIPARGSRLCPASSRVCRTRRCHRAAQ